MIYHNIQLFKWMKSNLLYIKFFLQPITCWYWTHMLEANVHELMLLYRCSSERNDFISYTSFFPANKGSSLINRKKAAQQATTKAKARRGVEGLEVQLERLTQMSMPSLALLWGTRAVGEDELPWAHWQVGRHWHAQEQALSSESSYDRDSAV